MIATQWRKVFNTTKPLLPMCTYAMCVNITVVVFLFFFILYGIFVLGNYLCTVYNNTLIPPKWMVRYFYFGATRKLFGSAFRIFFSYWNCWLHAFLSHRHSLHSRIATINENSVMQQQLEPGLIVFILHI